MVIFDITDDDDEDTSDVLGYHTVLGKKDSISLKRIKRVLIIQMFNVYVTYNNDPMQ